jgi:type IV pilus assembly protein PilP
MRAFKTFTLVLLVASATAILGAQQTKASTTPPKPASPSTPAPAADAGKDAKDAKDAKDVKPAPPAETYTYDPAGRRDPFLNLVGVTNDPRTNARKGDVGPSGMTIAEISVRGVMQSRGKLIAMVMGPDNKTYIVHQGDRLLDGEVKLITPQGLVIEQEVNDPLSVVKQREVRKLLRGLEETK